MNDNRYCCWPALSLAKTSVKLLTLNFCLQKLLLRFSSQFSDEMRFPAAVIHSYLLCIKTFWTNSGFPHGLLTDLELVYVLPALLLAVDKESVTFSTVFSSIKSSDILSWNKFRCECLCSVTFDNLLKVSILVVLKLAKTSCIQHNQILAWNS